MLLKAISKLADTLFPDAPLPLPEITAITAAFPVHVEEDVPLELLILRAHLHWVFQEVRFHPVLGLPWPVGRNPSPEQRGDFQVAVASFDQPVSTFEVQAFTRRWNQSRQRTLSLELASGFDLVAFELQHRVEARKFNLTTADPPIATWNKAPDHRQVYAACQSRSLMRSVEWSWLLRVSVPSPS